MGATTSIAHSEAALGSAVSSEQLAELLMGSLPDVISGYAVLCLIYIYFEVCVFALRD